MKQKFYQDDTIVAISTPPGEGGIGIVRLSGNEALSIADKVFVCKNNKKPSRFNSYTTHYGWIKDGEVIDEVLLTIMKAPKTYTKEDIVEINCHSGIIPLRKTLELALKHGARVAQPGEFTKRAFLNGRIDLSQAEAVLDVVASKTEHSLRAAVTQLKGGISKEIKVISSSLVGILAHIEASLDFPEEGLELSSRANTLKTLKKINSQLENLYESSSYGMIIKEGITTVIAGRPNVGKSSLLNSLLGQDRAIVTSIAGTTVDTIEEVIDIDGIPVKVVDTAGIIEPKDLIQTQAVKRSNKYLERADLVLLILDASQTVKTEDKTLIERIKKKEFIVVLNKRDLKKRINLNRLKAKLKNKITVNTSATKKTGLSRLKKEISKTIWKGKVKSYPDVMITNARHKEAVRKAFLCTKKAYSNIENCLSEEFIAEDLKEALNELGAITGNCAREEVLDKIFSEFCIGK